MKGFADDLLAPALHRLTLLPKSSTVQSGNERAYSIPIHAGNCRSGKNGNSRVPATAWSATAVVRPPASHAQNGNTGNNSGKNIGKNGNATTLLALAYPVPPVPRSPGKISIRATHPPPATLPARIPATPARIPAISPAISLAMNSAICLATFSTPRSRSRRAWEEWPQVGVRLILSNANSIL